MRATLPKLTEKQWMAQVVQAARLFGWKVYHTYDSRRSAAGWPDLALCRRDRLIFAELKTDGGRLTPQQRDWLDALAATGVTVAVWRPADLDLILKELE